MNQEKAVYQASPESEMLMLEPEIIQRIRAFAELGWGSKRIAQELCVARNTARRYLRNLHIVGPHQRPQRRSLGAEMAAEAARLLREEAAGNAVVVHRLLGTQGARASVRTVQRVVAPERRCCMELSEDAPLPLPPHPTRPSQREIFRVCS
jgi:hypothetical protein